MKSDAEAKLGRATSISGLTANILNTVGAGLFLFPASLASTLGAAFWSVRSPWPFITSFALAQPLEIATTT